MNPIAGNRGDHSRCLSCLRQRQSHDAKSAVKISRRRVAKQNQRTIRNRGDQLEILTRAAGVGCTRRRCGGDVGHNRGDGHDAENREQSRTFHARTTVVRRLPKKRNAARTVESAAPNPATATTSPACVHRTPNINAPHNLAAAKRGRDPGEAGRTHFRRKQTAGDSSEHSFRARIKHA